MLCSHDSFFVFNWFVHFSCDSFFMWFIFHMIRLVSILLLPHANFFPTRFIHFHRILVTWFVYFHLPLFSVSRSVFFFLYTPHWFLITRFIFNMIRLLSVVSFPYESLIFMSFCSHDLFLFIRFFFSLIDSVLHDFSFTWFSFFFSGFFHDSFTICSCDSVHMMHVDFWFLISIFWQLFYFKMIFFILFSSLDQSLVQLQYPTSHLHTGSLISV